VSKGIAGSFSHFFFMITSFIVKENKILWWETDESVWLWFWLFGVFVCLFVCLF